MANESNNGNGNNDRERKIVYVAPVNYKGASKVRAHRWITTGFYTLGSDGKMYSGMSRAGGMDEEDFTWRIKAFGLMKVNGETRIALDEAVWGTPEQKYYVSGEDRPSFDPATYSAKRNIELSNKLG